MRLAAWSLAVLLALAQGARAERVVTDSVGREVKVPDRIERVFAAGPPASVLLYVLAPDRMVGWQREPRPEDLPYIAPEYRDMPVYGSLTGGDTVNLEVLLQTTPDLIVDFGSVLDTYVSLAERVQAQTGIPYVTDRRPIREHRRRGASARRGNQALVLREGRALAAEGYGIVLSTHDPDHAFACATEVALLHDGGSPRTGRPLRS